MSRKKVCIITGSRAEWGLFYPLCREIEVKGNLDLQIIVTGGHLSDRFGMTSREIESDGFGIDSKIPLPFAEDTTESVMNSISEGLKGFAKELGRLRPDIVFVLGDRFEIFAAAQACLFARIPIAHIHGGELTEGSLDNSMRHAITKFAHLHFVSAEDYGKRVIQMGEHPDTVFHVGALGLDNVMNTKLLEREQFENETGLSLGEKNILVTFHPPTAESKEDALEQARNLICGLDQIGGANIIFTLPNPDIYSGAITSLIEDYVAANPAKSRAVRHLGRVRYLSALQFMDMVCGNSSSGIIEVPSFGIPTINVGSREKGRIKAGSVIDADGSTASLSEAFRKAFSPDFRQFCRNVNNPYGDGKAAERIVRVIEKTEVKNISKGFFDIGHKYGSF
ncbi:MAG: UDP-N-acetylglucosamine 2-epimerase (hydrolyzing) [Candidatus Omnitrophica bacterium]|nr:UDP-N-acetylglucosamine 2-epimerase (hydrolyzing) [Candidatus Omnitrophota bacterium]